MSVRRRPASVHASVLALGVGAVLCAAVAVAALRVQVAPGDTVEALAERHYGDVRRAPVVRAFNRIADGRQPDAGAVVKLPGPVLHTVQVGETLQSVADRFLSGEGAPELLAEANGLARGASLKPGQVLTIFAELELKPAGRSAEELATTYLLDANLGARLRRYNGTADAGRLPSRVYVPLVGLEPAPVAPPVSTSPASTPPASTPPASTPPASTPPAAAPPSSPAPAADPPAVAANTAPSGAPSDAPSAAPPEPPPALDLRVPVTSKRATLAGFSHAMHTPMTVAGVPVGCLACHERTAPDAVTHRPPSYQNCLLCHRESDELPAALRQGVSQRLPLPMNHKVHVGGAALGCGACHQHDPQRALGMGNLGHAACVSCHSPAGGKAPLVAGDPSAQGCTGCHGSSEVEAEGTARRRYFQAHLLRPAGRTGDVVFTHTTHRAFAPGGAPDKGPAVGCVVCHADVPGATTRAEVGSVSMQGCTECHRQATAVGLQPPESCQDCHLHHRAGAPPRGDELVKRPIDHTAFFRRHHADAAREQGPLCAACHAGAASDGNRCDTCHVQMRPRDHTAGFRDKVHGRQSQVDPARCQTCHRAERCESCHREVPRSHFPLTTWVDQGLHGTRGRLEMGSCLTCHRFETTCSRCHSAVAN